MPVSSPVADTLTTRGSLTMYVTLPVTSLVVLSLSVAVAVSWLVSPSRVSCPLPVIASRVAVGGAGVGGGAGGGVGVGADGWSPQLTHVDTRSATNRTAAARAAYCIAEITAGGAKSNGRSANRRYFTGARAFSSSNQLRTTWI